MLESETWAWGHWILLLIGLPGTLVKFLHGSEVWLVPHKGKESENVGRLTVPQCHQFGKLSLAVFWRSVLPNSWTVLTFAWRLNSKRQAPSGGLSCWLPNLSLYSQGPENLVCFVSSFRICTKSESISIFWTETKEGKVWLLTCSAPFTYPPCIPTCHVEKSSFFILRRVFCLFDLFLTFQWSHFLCVNTFFSTLTRLW